MQVRLPEEQPPTRTEQGLGPEPGHEAEAHREKEEPAETGEESDPPRSPAARPAKKRAATLIKEQHIQSEQPEPDHDAKARPSTHRTDTDRRQPTPQPGAT